MSGQTAAFLTAAAVAAAGILFALTIRDADAAATMRPRQSPASSQPAVPAQAQEGNADIG